MIVADREIFNPNIPNLPTRDEVEKLCRQKGFERHHLVYIANDTRFFIKYNNAKMAEAHSQLFFHSQIRRLRSKIHIPEIYHAWRPAKGAFAYIVMEYIDIDHFASDEERDRAITELINVSPPPGLFGSLVRQEFIRHPFFRDREARRSFSSASELEGAINNVHALFMQPRSISYLILRIDPPESDTKWPGIWPGRFQRRAPIMLLWRYLSREFPG